MALAAAQEAAYAPCPNSCSGHGNCDNPDRQCDCFDGFTGADCSLMTCPLGPAWADEATGVDAAHNMAECSNRGLCDRTKGTCTCEPGRFEGKACERRTCPNSCNFRGRCESMNALATMRDPGELITQCDTSLICVNSDCSTTNYDNCRSVYAYDNVWDAEMMYGCVCDDGFYGVDCSLRNCPTGDDPLTGSSSSTTPEVNHKMIVTCTATGGTFTLTFKGETTSAIAWDATTSDLITALHGLTTIKSDFDTAVTVTYSGTNLAACKDDSNTIDITFTQNFGNLPLIIPDGSLLTSTGVFEASITTATSIPGTKEDDFCSNRGVCDTETGVCTCTSTDFATSNGANAAGQRGDCGYQTVSQVTSCPGTDGIDCNGKGNCLADYVCECMQGYTGADCSLLACPSGKNWFGFPTAANNAHLDLVECSGAGLCDTEAGTCECMDGFTGSACQLMSCPGDPVCNGNGICYTMGDLAELATVNGEATAYTYGKTPNDPLTWDYDKIQGCKCDEGFEGYDCSLMSCPYGDDPENNQRQFNEVQMVVCDESTGTDGSFQFKFREVEMASPLAYSATVADVKAALEKLSSIASVHVYHDDTSLDATTAAVCASGGRTIYVEFLRPTADVPLLVASYTNLEEVVVSEFRKGTKEWIECSGRGLCDYELGTCTCVTGFGASDGQGNSGIYADCGYKMPIVVGDE
eukprot:CAMPEP_0118644248 /NCGR_PEP_ID=MMETSP0785-20121206/6837_1 /TAXON_ID=91992 /ORGANISM="Bolidomonas pacifica, Strain CCMP 1866" /LENGTH=693 /DNA_ID=CAMNT_0006535993 /DNA_START=32 /DNA_END=2113 /DNA_ORIENTATION=-